MEEYSIRDIQKLLENNSLTSENLIKQYLKRIEEIDSKTNAIIEINPDAIKIAIELDIERDKGKIRGPLHGIPVVLKDNINTSDNMMTTAGSLALEGNYASNDAFIVKSLREAGAIILAKSNLSEWANFRGKHSSSGWSSRGKQTNNPYSLDRNPCGSSSGSAVAVAANLCTVAIGTETDGSIICPSNVNGVVGIKPTLGLISRAGIIPIAHSQDTAGPIARSVEDAAILLGILIGYDENDKITSNASKGKSDYTQFLDKNGLRGARLGFSKKLFNSSPKVKKIMDKVIDELKYMGAELIEFDDFPIIDDLGSAEFTILLFEYKYDLNKYLNKLSDNVKVHSVKDLIKFNSENSDKILNYFGQEYLEEANEKGSLDDEEYINAIKLCDEYRNNIREFMDLNNLDALIAPSGGPAWKTDHINGDNHAGSISSTHMAAITGYSNITVPAGYISGLPVGLSFTGRAFAEPTIIKFAYAFELRTKVRYAPEFIQSINE